MNEFWSSFRIGYSHVEKNPAPSQNKKMTLVLTCFAFCTEEDQIHTVIWQLLLFCAKKYGTGWMDGWMDGWVGG